MTTGVGKMDTWVCFPVLQGVVESRGSWEPGHLGSFRSSEGGWYLVGGVGSPDTWVMLFLLEAKWTLVSRAWQDWGSGLQGLFPISVFLCASVSLFIKLTEP